MNIGLESGAHGAVTPTFLMSLNDDEKSNDIDENERFLEEMLAKAALLANEIKEISSKQSYTTSSKSSTGKDGVRRSLPKVIDVQPNDDYTARSECSSLGYSLATATPSVFVVNGTLSGATTTPTTMNLLSTTIENCAEGYFLKSHPRSSSTTTNTCSVINEDTVNHDHDEKTSCCDSDSVSKMSHHVHKYMNNNIENNTENIPNMSSVDMLMQPKPTSSSYLQTPPKVKRTSQHQLDPTGKLPLTSTNSALQTSAFTTKSLSEEVNKNDNPLLLSSSAESHVHERPTVLNISQNDDDYVPIADYSIRNTTTTKASNTSAVKWEKITAPSINDDDYVSLKDYSRFPKLDARKHPSKSVTNTSTGLSFAQKRELLIKRRRQRKRFVRRLVMVGTIATSMLLYYCYRNDWFQSFQVKRIMTLVVNHFLPQPHPMLPDNVISESFRPIELIKNEIDEKSIDAIVENDDVNPTKNINTTVDNETVLQADTSDHLQNEQSHPQPNLDETMMVTSNVIGTTANTAMNELMTSATVNTISETLSIFEPKSRQRFVEELINSMMQ